MTRPRVLAADDDPSLLASITLVLEDWGAEVVGARTGDELVTKLATDGPFDLIVSDVSMPWMTGLEVLRSARWAGVATPIIVITGQRDDRIAEQVRSLGSNVVLLRKPFEIEELERAAERLLRGAGDAAKATDDRAARRSEP